MYIFKYLAVKGLRRFIIDTPFTVHNNIRIVKYQWVAGFWPDALHVHQPAPYM